MIREAELELTKGPTGSGSVVMRARVAPLGSDHVLVLAEDLCDCRLQSVALGFLVLGVLALPAGLLLGHWRRGAHAD